MHSDITFSETTCHGGHTTPRETPGCAPGSRSAAKYIHGHAPFILQVLSIYFHFLCNLGAKPTIILFWHLPPRSAPDGSRKLWWLRLCSGTSCLLCCLWFRAFLQSCAELWLIFFVIEKVRMVFMWTAAIWGMLVTWFSACKIHSPCGNGFFSGWLIHYCWREISRVVSTVVQSLNSCIFSKTSNWMCFHSEIYQQLFSPMM